MISLRDNAFRDKTVDGNIKGDKGGISALGGKKKRIPCPFRAFLNARLDECAIQAKGLDK